jgi:tetratricopeptide (TPR) repeat protein
MALVSLGRAISAYSEIEAFTGRPSIAGILSWGHEGGMDRKVALRQILEENPSDPLARYGLAMEHVKEQDYQAAVAEFEKLLAVSPGYLYAYFHAGQALEKLGRLDEARNMYERGIQVASAAGDHHARSELAAALEQIG